MRRLTLASILFASIVMLPFVYIQFSGGYEFAEGGLGIETYEYLHGWPLRFGRSWVSMGSINRTVIATGSKSFPSAIVFNLALGAILWVSIALASVTVGRPRQFRLVNLLVLTFVVAVVLVIHSRIEKLTPFLGIS